jgi:hypothetical protein
MTVCARVSVTLRYAVELLPGDLREQGRMLLTPWAIGTMAAMIGVSAGAQFTPFGWFADLVMFALGPAALGTAAIQVTTDLREFACGVVSAETDNDLRAAARHLARAISVIGVGTLLLWLTKRGARTVLSASETLSVARSVVLDVADREVALWSGVKPEQIPRRYATLERMLGETPAGRDLLQTLEAGGFKKFKSVWYELSDRMGVLAEKSGKPVHYFVSEERGYYDALNPTEAKLTEWWAGYRPKLVQGTRSRLRANKGAAPLDIEREVTAEEQRLSKWTKDDIEAQYYAEHRRSRYDHRYIEDEAFHKIEKHGLRGAWVHELDPNGIEIRKWRQAF